jgi:hypothetical protein
VTRPNYFVRIVWESDRHFPDWELQTEHPGFMNWMAPALFAHGCTTPHPRLLTVAAGVVTLVLDTGAELQLAGDGAVLVAKLARAGQRADDPRTTPGFAGIRLSLWQLDPAQREQDLAVCEAYREHVGANPADFSRAGLDGTWRPQSYEVIGPDGHVPVVVEVRQTGIVSVRVERHHVDDGADGTTHTSVTRA